MSTNDVPGANPVNRDVLAMGCWAEHEDGSLILVEKGKKKADATDNIKWTWHDKSPFPWTRVMRDFPSGEKYADVQDELNAAQRVAQSLQLRAEAVREREYANPSEQRAATAIMSGILEAIKALRR